MRTIQPVIDVVEPGKSQESCQTPYCYIESGADRLLSQGRETPCYWRYRVFLTHGVKPHGGGGFGETGKPGWAWWSADTITPLTKNAGEASTFQPLASRAPVQNLGHIVGYEDVRRSVSKKTTKGCIPTRSETFSRPSTPQLQLQSQHRNRT